MSEENCAHSPTAPSVVSPSGAIIMVSTMEPVVVSRFCSATGMAITATLFTKRPQWNLRLFMPGISSILAQSGFIIACAAREA